MLKIIAAAATIMLASNAYALKCQSGKKVLYTDAPSCPTKYTPSTSDSTGNVSTIGKSDEIREQEDEFLRQRENENQQYRAQVEQAQRQSYQQESRSSSQCAALAEQALALESAMRQPNSAQWLDYLKQQHRTVRNEQFRLKC